MKKYVQILVATVVAFVVMQSFVYAQTTYTWSGGSQGDYQVSTNWAPTRSVPAKSDILQFTSSAAITNVPTQTIGQLLLSNNASVSLQATSGKSTILTVGSSNLSGDEISVPFGCSLTIATNASGVATETFTLGLANVAGVTSSIAGTLNIQPNSTTLPNDTVSFSLNTSYSVNQLVTNQGVLFNVTTAGTSAVTGLGPGAFSGSATNGTVVFTYVGTWFGSSYATGYNNVYDVHYGVTTVTGTVNYAGRFNNTSTLATTPNTLQFLSGSTFNNQRKDALFPGTDTGSAIHTVTNAPNYTNVNVMITGLTGTGGGAFFDQLPASVDTLNINVPNFTGASGSSQIRVYSLANNGSFSANAVNIATGAGVSIDFHSSAINTLNIGSGGLNISGGVFDFADAGSLSAVIIGDLTLSNRGGIVFFGYGTTAAYVASITANNFNQSDSLTSFNLSNDSNATATFIVNGNFTKTAGTFTATYPATIRFAGSVPQTISTNATIGSASTIIEIANTGSSGNNTVTLNSPFKVAGVLKLTSGVLVSSAINYLTLGTSGYSGGGASAYVSGEIQYKSASKNPFTLPFGTNGSYYPITITPSATTSIIFDAQFLPTTSNSNNLKSPVTSVYPYGSYSIQTTTGSIKASVAITYNLGAGVVNSTSDLVLATYSSTNMDWYEVSAFPTVTGSATNGTITDTTAITITKSPSLFTIGSINKASSLPVVLKSFTASYTQDGNQLNWESSVENNLASYQVERLNTSIGQWGDIATIYAKGKGSSYQFTDNTSMNKASYRLKLIDKDGTFAYSKVVTVVTDHSPLTTIYPNPLIGKTLNVSLANAEAGKYIVSIYDVLGKKLSEQSISHPGGSATHALSIYNTLARGTYSVVIREEASGQIVYQTSLIMDNF